MNIRFIFSLTALFCFFILTSCGSDPEPDNCSAAWFTDLESELNTLVSTAIAYNNDTENATKCLAYKNALQNYVNKLKPYGNCTALTGQNKIDYQTALAEAEQEITTLCN
jgi:hypothetical protein